MTSICFQTTELYELYKFEPSQKSPGFFIDIQDVLFE